MSKSLILAIDELASGQTQAFTTVNDMLSALEQSANKPLTIALSASGATYSVAELDAARYGAYSFGSQTVECTVTFPATINGNTTYRKISVINTSSTYDILFKSGAGSSITIPTGASREILISGTTITVLAEGTKVYSVPHSTAFFAGGVPTAFTEVGRYSFVEKVYYGNDFTGFLGSCGVNPSVPVYFTVNQEGSEIGRITVSTAGTVSIDLHSPAVDATFEVGDVLTLVYSPYEVGTIFFNNVADGGDTVTIDDGSLGPTVFTFGANPAPGASATASAQNLQAAIQASSLNVDVLRSGSTLTIINLETAGGGSITKSDADNDYTVTDFAADSTGADFGVTFKGTRI